MDILIWKGEGAFQDEVVGESHYQPALKRIAAGEKRKRVMARLVCEPENQYDKDAVRVDVDGKTVGHLPRERAKLHHQRLKRLNQPTAIVECEAVIVTGSQGISGVFLDLPFTVRGDPAAKEPVAPKSASVALEFNPIVAAKSESILRRLLRQVRGK